MNNNKYLDTVSRFYCNCLLIHMYFNVVLSIMLKCKILLFFLFLVGPSFFSDFAMLGAMSSEVDVKFMELP